MSFEKVLADFNAKATQGINIYRHVSGTQPWDGTVEECECCGLRMPTSLLFICEYCLLTYCLVCVSSKKSYYTEGRYIHTFCSRHCKKSHQIKECPSLAECIKCRHMVTENDIQTIDSSIGHICYTCLQEMED